MVVGGGPGGAACAREAAKKGLDVLLLEKDEHPRRKICAGGFRADLPNLLDYEIRQVIEHETCGSHVYAPSGLRVVCTKPQLTGYTVKRSKFDHFMLHMAEQAGAEVKQGAEVRELNEGSNEIRVWCRNGDTFSSKYLVGADGVNSRVARASGIKQRWEDHEIGLCIEARVPMDSAEIMRITRGPYEDTNRVCIEIFFGGIQHGYAWCFPKREEVSLGMGCLMTYAKDLKGAWENFVKSFERRNDVTLDLSEASAMRIPLAGPIRKTVTERIMLVGDSAGFVSPATGEGIYYAIETGKIAAEVVHDISRGEARDTREYERRWKGNIGKEMRVSSFLANLMFNSERNMETVVQMAASDEVMAVLLAELIGGLRRYTDLRKLIMTRVLTRHPLKGFRLLI